MGYDMGGTKKVISLRYWGMDGLMGGWVGVYFPCTIKGEKEDRRLFLVDSVRFQYTPPLR